MKGPHTYTTTGATTQSAPNLDELARTLAQMRADKKKCDDQLAAALRDLIGPESVRAAMWAARLGVSFLELLGVAEGREPPSAAFWERCQAYFGRARAAFDQAIEDAERESQATREVPSAG